MVLLAATDYASIIGLLVAALLGGTGLAGLIAAKKVKPEVEGIAMSSVISVNKELRTELSRQVELRVAAETRAERLETERQELLDKVRGLRDRVDALESELSDVEARLDERGQ